MRFTVVTYGSEGDTRPFVALCRGLMDAGHEVLFFAEQSSTYIAQQHGIPVETLAGDVKTILPLDNPSQELTPRELVKTVRTGLRSINANVAAWMAAVARHAQTADAVLHSGLASLAAQVVAQEVDKPAISLWLQPTTPTREFASPILPLWHLPGWLNRLSYRVSPGAMIRRLYGKSTEAARLALFPHSKRGKIPPEAPILYGFSKHIVPRPRDWPARDIVCGHWSLPPLEWRPPADLGAFLSAGPPPIYVGFGAASSFIRRRKLNDLVSAIDGRRALFYPGWSKITESMLPDNFFVIGETPHSWLFPLTSMVIHHGGAGTTHSAARAGVPSVVLPFGGDQPFWAHRLASLGVAPKYIRQSKLNARTLTELLQLADGPDVRSRAQALGTAMAEEDGVDFAVAVIETHLRVGTR